MQKWKYDWVIVVGSSITETRTKLQELLNERGQKGWEAYAITSSDDDRILTAYLKQSVK